MITRQRNNVKPLSRIVKVIEKPQASSNIEYDSLNVIPGYIPNSNTNEAIERFNEGLRRGGSAISITGPYGSGKSTFGVILNQLVAPNNDVGFRQALKKIRDVYDDMAVDIEESRDATGIHKTGMIRCVVTARQEPISATILRAITNGVESYFGTDYDKSDFTHAITLRRLSKTANVPDAGSIIDLITSLASVSPVLLMIDEFGKNIEYFADGGNDGDLFLLQELAEMSGKSRRMHLHIVTMQHMAFGEYVAGTLAGRMREWGKIQGRFEDIHFSNSLEHTRAVLGSSLESDNKSMHRIMEWANAHTNSTVNDAGVNINAELVASCYPLHPLVVEALPELCSRYGQNERTLLSFVLGGGPSTVSRFIDESVYSDGTELPTMGIDMLYDYFISSSGTFRAGSTVSSRLVEIDTIIRDVQGLDKTRLATLKAIGILNLIGRSGRLRASIGMLRCVVGSNVEHDISYLESHSIITYRQHADEYRIWHGTDVNIAAKLDAWRKAKHDMSFHDIMKSAMEPEPVVAARHGIETGNVRILKCVFDAENVDFENYDGAIIYGNSDTPILKYDKPVAVFRCSDISSLVAAAIEVFALRNVMKDDEVAKDHVAKSETGERLVAAEATLTAEFGRAYNSRAVWTYKKKDEKKSQQGTASSAASKVCSVWYDSTPKIRNEMINRNDLTGQGATARNRLMAAIVEKWGSDEPWFDNWSPERAVYDTMIRDNDIHKKLAPSNKNGLRKPWREALDRLRGTNKAVELEDIYHIWRRPPFGMKNGTMPILALMIIMSKRDRLAIYEHGTYVPKLSVGLVERMAKNPQHFRIKWFKKTASRELLVRETSRNLGLGENSEMLGIVGYVVSVVRTLPAYSMHTKTLDKKILAVRSVVQNAMEPDTLLFESIPQALGMKPFGESISKSKIQSFSNGLKKCMDNLNNALENVLNESKARLFGATSTADRAGLARIASELLPHVSDHSMKVFLGAVSADIPDDKEWIKYVGLILTDVPPADWNDENVTMFGNKMDEISARFRRLVALKFSKVAKDLAGPSIMVTKIHPDGHEEYKVIPADDKRAAKIFD